MAGSSYGPVTPVGRLSCRGLVSVRFLRTAQWTRASPVSAIADSVCNFVVPSF